LFGNHWKKVKGLSSTSEQMDGWTDRWMDGWMEGMNVEQSCCGHPKWTTHSILVTTQQSKVGMNDYYHIYIYLLLLLWFMGAIFSFFRGLLFV
jgi:hypothetical protein